VLSSAFMSNSGRRVVKSQRLFALEYWMLPSLTNAFELIGSYAAFVLAMWAPFGPFNGMSYEIGFALQSETSPFLNGFFFGDPLRVHTNFFYHLAYLFSKVIGLHGSWLAYQVVYTLLWFGRGILCYLIIKRLAPNLEMFAFLAGSLAIFHASDHTLNWVGQLNQFGFIFWMLLSFLMLIHALDASSERRALVWATLAAAFNYMSLWSYEAHLPVVLVAPWLFAVWRRKGWRRPGIVVAFYLLPAIIFIGMNVSRYVGGTGGGYQVSVLRSEFSISGLVSDLGFNLKYALAFWHWAELIPAQYAQQMYVGAPLFGAAAASEFSGLSHAQFRALALADTVSRWPIRRSGDGRLDQLGRDRGAVCGEPGARWSPTADHSALRRRHCILRNLGLRANSFVSLCGLGARKIDHGRRPHGGSPTGARIDHRTARCATQERRREQCRPVWRQHVVRQRNQAVVPGRQCNRLLLLVWSRNSTGKQIFL
jgi:hypothetical protein